MKKKIVITGGNSGIGKALVEEMCARGHEVIVIARDSQKTKAVIQTLVQTYGPQTIQLVPADLSRVDDIQNAVTALVNMNTTIDVLINNAGVLKLKKELAQDNVEMTMSVNLLAAYRLTQGLLDAGTPIRRIINITSELFKKGTLDFEDMINPKKYKGQQVYCNTKLANLALSAQWYAAYGKRIDVIALHPGVVASSAFRDYPTIFMNFMNLFLEKPASAAAKIADVALADVVKSGWYYNQAQAKGPIESYLGPDDPKKLQAFLNDLP